jgi:hypothetical protein
VTSVVLYPASLLAHAQNFNHLVPRFSPGTVLIVAPRPVASGCRLLILVTAIQSQGVPVAFVSEDAFI